MGYKQGPVFSQILSALEDAQLEGKVETVEEAKRYILSKFSSKTAETSKEQLRGADGRARISTEQAQ
jgi:hypothetical protein